MANKQKGEAEPVTVTLCLRPMDAGDVTLLLRGLLKVLGRRHGVRCEQITWGGTDGGVHKRAERRVEQSGNVDRGDVPEVGRHRNSAARPHRHTDSNGTGSQPQP